MAALPQKLARFGDGDLPEVKDRSGEDCMGARGEGLVQVGEVAGAAGGDDGDPDGLWGGAERGCAAPHPQPLTMLPAVPCARRSGALAC